MEDNKLVPPKTRFQIAIDRAMATIDQSNLSDTARHEFKSELSATLDRIGTPAQLTVDTPAWVLPERHDEFARIVTAACDDTARQTHDRIVTPLLDDVIQWMLLYFELKSSKPEWR